MPKKYAKRKKKVEVIENDYAPLTEEKYNYGLVDRLKAAVKGFKDPGSVIF